jgi:transcriptional regulator with XRE-family HTH domain
MMKSNDKNTDKLSIAEILKNRNQTRADLVMKKMSLAKKIYESILRKGMNQKDFAESLKKNPSEISKWLSGTHNFTIETIFEIERVLNINLIDWGGEETAVRFFINFKETVASQSAGVIGLEKGYTDINRLTYIRIDSARNDMRRAVA